MKRWSNIL